MDQRDFSCFWIPYASFRTTGQFEGLENGFVRHCGPTAIVNVIRTLENLAKSKGIPFMREMSDEELFLLCAGTGRRLKIYWNANVLRSFGGTSNPLTGIYLRRCLAAVRAQKLPSCPKSELRTAKISEWAAAGCPVQVHFHPLLTEDAAVRALRRGEIVYLQVYGHPKYGSHHMLCYAYRETEGGRRFLVSDGWAPKQVWIPEGGLGRGHFLTIAPVRL